MNCSDNKEKLEASLLTISLSSNISCCLTAHVGVDRNHTPIRGLPLVDERPFFRPQVMMCCSAPMMMTRSKMPLSMDMSSNMMAFASAKSASVSFGASMPLASAPSKRLISKSFVPPPPPPSQVNTCFIY